MAETWSFCHWCWGIERWRDRGDEGWSLVINDITAVDNWWIVVVVVVPLYFQSASELLSIHQITNITWSCKWIFSSLGFTLENPRPLRYMEIGYVWTKGVDTLLSGTYRFTQYPVSLIAGFVPVYFPAVLGRSREYRRYCTVPVGFRWYRFLIDLIGRGRRTRLWLTEQCLKVKKNTLACDNRLQSAGRS